MDGVGAGVSIPIFPLADGIPLRFSTTEMNFCKSRTITKRIRTNSFDTLWNVDAFQTRTICKSIFSDAGDTRRNVNGLNLTSPKKMVGNMFYILANDDITIAANID